MSDLDMIQPPDDVLHIDQVHGIIQRVAEPDDSGLIRRQKLLEGILGAKPWTSEDNLRRSDEQVKRLLNDIDESELSTEVGNVLTITRPVQRPRKQMTEKDKQWTADLMQAYLNDEKFAQD
jgi:hypothetical protein